MLGPIDYIAVGFKGNNFDGSVLEELTKAVEKGVIRVIDLVFIMKDKDGTVAAGEFEDQPAELKAMFGSVTTDPDMPLLTEDDVEKLGKDMENDTAAGVLVIEQVWAKGLKEALINAGGMLIAEGRIHPEVIAEAIKEIESEGSKATK